MPIHKWMDRLIVVYPYNRIVLNNKIKTIANHKKGWISRASFWMKEIRPKRVHTLWVHLYETLKKINSIYSDKNGSAIAWYWAGQRESTAKGSSSTSYMICRAQCKMKTWPPCANENDPGYKRTFCSEENVYLYLDLGWLHIWVHLPKPIKLELKWHKFLRPLKGTKVQTS